MNSPVLSHWHQAVQKGDVSLLDSLLADDVVFHSPVVHTPQRGKQITAQYLFAAFKVLANDTFRYVREIEGDHQAVLEFMVEIDDIEVNGVDMLKWNEQQQITEFKVLVRPLKAIQLVHQKMAAMLAAR